MTGLVADTYAVRGRLLLDGRFEAGAVVIEGDRIGAVLREPRDGDLPPDVREAALVAPGLIDLQVNGGFGVEVGDDPGAIATLSARLPERGVTAYLPTVITAPAAFYPKALAAFATARLAAGTRALGLHLEGPFLSPARKGAHQLRFIEAADDAILDEWLQHDTIRLVTLAPECAGAIRRLQRLVDHGVVVSLGHTNATLEEFSRGVDAGATMATHLYNAMSPFGHRAPGVIGAALTDDRITAGLIADGTHAHPAAVRLAVRAKGPERIALVSDLMTAAGLGPGTYSLGGQAVTVDTDSARLADGTLAGAILTLDAAVRNVARWTDATPAAALRMATETPARALGLTDQGRLHPGFLADLTLLNDDLTVAATIIGGRVVYDASRAL